LASQALHSTWRGAAGAIWLRIDSMDQAIWASGTVPKDLLDWSYRAAQAVAADNLALGWDIIADCVNDCQEARDGWEAIGQRTGAEVKWLEVVCSDPSNTVGELRQDQVTLEDWPCPTGMQSFCAHTMIGTMTTLSSTRHIAIWTCASRRPSTSCVDEVRCLAR
jgi:hypothetical protein